MTDDMRDFLRAEAEHAPQPSGLAQGTVRRGRRRRASLIAASFLCAALVTVGVSAGVTRLGDGSRPISPAEDETARTARVTAVVPIGLFPDNMELIDGDIWVTGDDPQDADDRYSWVRIDATTNDTENLPIDLRGGVFDQGGDAIFAVDLDSEFQSQLLRIDSRTFSEVARTELGCTADGESPDCYPMEVSSDANTAWVGLASDSLSGEVVRIDPATNEIVARIPIPQGQPLEMVIAGGSLWISAFSDSRNTNATLVRVDIETNEVVDTLFRDQLDVGNISPPVIAASEKEVWVVRRTDRGPTLHSGAILVRLDAETGEVLSESKNLQVTGSYPSVHPFAADNEGLWFYGGGTVAIHRLDVDTMEVTQSLDLSDLVKHAVEIVQDPETGTIWVVRFGGGVIRIETR